MSFSKTVTFWCDEEPCNEWIEFTGNSAWDEWYQAKEQGWTGDPNESYCPEHSE